MTLPIVDQTAGNHIEVTFSTIARLYDAWLVDGCTGERTWLACDHTWHEARLAAVKIVAGTAHN